MNETDFNEWCELAAEDAEIVRADYAISRDEALSRLLGSIYYVADNGTTTDVRAMISHLSNALGYAI